MRKGRLYSRLLAFGITSVMVVSTAFSGIGNTSITAKAVESKGSLATEVTGKTGSGATNASLLANMPSIANAGKSRFTTANYDANNGAVDTSNWGTSLLWDLDGSGEPYGFATFAIPWTFKADANKQGLLFSKPSSKVVNNGNGTGYVLDLAPSENDSEFCAIPGYTTNGLRVDKITDWTYDVVMQKADDTSTYMKTTMVQGSPFAYFEMVGTNTVTIERTRKQQSEIVKMADDGSMFVIRVNDPVDQEFTTGNYYDYYAFYAPSGTTWTTEDTSNGAYKITSIKATFPAGKSYFSTAVLTEQKANAMNNDAAIAIAESYKPYAYNFVTDTKAEYTYNEETHKVETTYTYTVDKKDGSTAEGTVMGILPHQYKNITGNPSYMSNTFNSIRGTIKMLPGSSFKTELTFTGIIPWLTDVDEEYHDTLSGYIDEYMKQFFPTGSYTESSITTNGQGTGGDTYWTGKALNRTSNVLAAAESIGDEENAEILLDGLKKELENWFTADGANDNKYFYYDESIGALFGFPESFNSVDQLNDHHFHYGYFIYTAAQVALRDPEWGQAYSGIVKELIYDIACPTRNNPNSRYPYLRNFAPFEGHSWASGHANFNDGNNQESSSEAINAWAGVILFGEAIGDETIRDLGIYLYTTEISAINNYWFDVDENVLADYYRYLDQYNHLTEAPPTNAVPTFNQATMVWGSKYEFTTWFGAHPMLVQGINLLPMNPSSFYLSLRSDYILENWEIAKKHAVDSNWEPDYNTVWNDVWSAYLALADPEIADEFWGRLGSEEGESKAHTFQYIYSLKKAGKPDLTVTSDATLSTCFVNDAGEKTYVAYNTDDKEKTVTFSDGKQLIVQPNTMESITSNETQGDTQYTIECYAPALDAEGNETDIYTVVKTVTERANKNTTITVEAPSVSGYVFDDNNSQNVLTGKVSEDGSLVLKAYYKKNTCTVAFNSNGGSAVESKSVRIGKTVSKPTNPTKEGYEFAGWYYGTEIFDFNTAITDNIILTAMWKKLVPNTDIPERVEKGIERKDDDLIMYLKSNQTSGVAFATAVSSMDATINTGTVGALSSDINPVVKNGDFLEFTIKNGANSYSGGYIAYWFNLDNTPTIVPVPEIPNVGEYKAVDTTNYEVKFVSDGEVLSSQLVQEFELVYKPLNPTKVECEFIGWYLGDEEYDFNTGVMSDMTLTAKWEEESIPLDKYYTVTYDSAGGSEVISESVLNGYAAMKPNDPSRDGYIFKGWYLDGQLYDFSTILTSDITLVAGWEEETAGPGTISVSGITVQGGNKTIKVGDTLALSVEVSPSNATNQNVTWSSSNPGIATVNASTGLVTAVTAGTITITATALDGSNVTGDCVITVEESQTTEEPIEPEIPVTYTVSFNLNGGTSVTGIASQTVEEGKTATEPESPIREGYTFKEWQLDGKLYDFSTAVTGNITLVATWTEIVIDDEDNPPVTVLVSNIEINGGNQTIKIGDSLALSAVITPSEATDKSVLWNSSKPEVASVNADTGLVQGLTAGTTTITVTALDGSNVSKSCEITVETSETTEETTEAPIEPENPIMYTVSFDTDGGSEVASQTIEEGKMVSQPTVPTKEGYTFKEWQLNGTTYDFNTAVTANITLVAIWTKNSSNDKEENPPIEIKVSQIVMTEATKVIKVGDTITLSAIAYPENATDRSMTWTTSDSSIATVNPVTGEVKGVSAGIVNISAIATDGSGTKSACVVTVQLTDIADTSKPGTTPDNPDSDKTPEVTTYTVTFDSAGGNVVAAQVVGKGNMAVMPTAPVREGYLFVGWYNGAVVYNFSDAVNSNLVLTAKWEAIQVSEIIISGISKKIAANKKIQLTAIVSEDALNKTVTWSVNNSKYASVSQTGLVKVKKAGKGKTVKVTATANDGSGVSKTYSIKIMHDAVKKITLTGNKSVKAGNQVKIKAKVSPLVSKKINKDLQWTSSNEEWATVTKKGVVKTYRAGKGKTVTITAKATDGSNKKKTFKIRIK